MSIRKRLKEKSILGLHGADAIRDEMIRRGETIIPAKRTDGEGRVRFLEKEFPVSEHWINRLVRAEIDLDNESITFYRLRR